MNMIKTPITSFTQLQTWQKAHTFVIAIYNITDKFPRKEIYSLTDQLRRAATSITSNIAEGFSRQSKKEKVQFYFQSLGSLTEVQNQLLIARDVDYLESSQFSILANQSVIISKLLNGLIKSIKKNI